MRVFKIILIFLIQNVISLTISADFHQVSNSAQIKEIISHNLDLSKINNTLLIFPFEKILLLPVDKVFYYPQNELQKLYLDYKKLNLETIDYFNELKLTNYKHNIDDPELLTLFNDLINRKLPIFTYTNNITGNFNEIKFLEIWSWKLLFSKGFDLSKSVIGDKQIIFDKNYKKFLGSYPTYYKGLLSCNSKNNINPCWSVIPSLLFGQFKWFPEKLIIIDNDENDINLLIRQLKSVKSDIEIIAIIYNPLKSRKENLNPNDLTKFMNEFKNKLNQIKR